MPYMPTGRELIDPFKVLEAAGIRADMTVADFGCGTLGHYVFPAAQMVGTHGKVYAIDILKSVLDGVNSKKKMENFISLMKYLKLGLVTDSKSGFTVKESIFASGTRNFNKKICSYLSGMFSGFLESQKKKHINIVETKCVANGDPYCEFKIV